MVEFRQGFRSMSEPLKEWQKLIISGRYRHGGNPVMRWMADNLVVRTDPNGNLAPDKSKSHEKIDGAVAAVMALSRAVTSKRGPSVYEDRGMEIV
jgi:phage terminase large subunit-like protein